MQQEVEQGHDNLHSSLKRHLEDEIVTLLNEKELKIQSLAQKLDSYQMKTKVSLDSIAQCQRHSYKLCKTLKQFRWDFDQEVVELQKSLRRDYVKQQTQAQDQDKKTKLIQILRKQLEMSSRTEERLDTSSRNSLVLLICCDLPLLSRDGPELALAGARRTLDHVVELHRLLSCDCDEILSQLRSRGSEPNDVARMQLIFGTSPRALVSSSLTSLTGARTRLHSFQSAHGVESEESDLVLGVLTMLIEILWFVEKERQGSSRVKLADSRRETPVGLQEQLRKAFEEANEILGDLKQIASDRMAERAGEKEEEQNETVVRLLQELDAAKRELHVAMAYERSEGNRKSQWELDKRLAEEVNWKQERQVLLQELASSREYVQVAMETETMMSERARRWSEERMGLVRQLEEQEREMEGLRKSKREAERRREAVEEHTSSKHLKEAATSCASAVKLLVLEAREDVEALLSTEEEQSACLATAVESLYEMLEVRDYFAQKLGETEGMVLDMEEVLLGLDNVMETLEALAGSLTTRFSV
ncbi:hypothetical protein GUITHDRAFT_112007 [Guillardia theta CCMP2712]|uniref:Uncharacterized protein n=1 Tax=Guillardia theta (strain CCMP2712) TaxID=905079 RepID=L1J160_GUITC|nr:hypothetical protein GUITHDRAFT_112007 [Guillardia theta CCMP2712]EKX41864.1 hypothetical protein GUITHDRAFT_112007 [Guillardia theta CCMP2712]|eukprot:XP_005828844.1 hypothetical protein GUITHDRAFT_112007 [Guillardia theta CCMP2712]